MMITLMFSVVATKSRTLSSSLYSANEQVSRSWEGTQPSRLPNWPMDIFRTIDVTVSLGMGLAGGQEALYSSHFCELKSSLVWKFEFFSQGVWSFLGVLQNFAKLVSSRFPGRCSETGCSSDWLLSGENCIVYSMFCIFIIIT